MSEETIPQNQQPAGASARQAQHSDALESASRKTESIGFIFWGVVAAFAIIFVVWGGITLAGQSQEKQLQREYLAMNDSTASEESFAKMHLDHPLGGLVLLRQANKYYTSGNYAAAKAAYEKVTISGLKDQPALVEQAILGGAFSAFALDPAKGLQELKSVAENTSLTQTSRAYVAEELMGYYAQKGDFKTAKDYQQLVKSLKGSPAWQHQADAIAQMYPELASKETK
jgi:hypothetical protein